MFKLISSRKSTNIKELQLQHLQTK